MEPTSAVAATKPPRPTLVLAPTQPVERTAKPAPTKAALLPSPTTLPAATTTLQPTEPPPAPTDAATVSAAEAPASFQPTELMLIPEGRLRMGSGGGDGVPPDQVPQHDVRMGSYLMERTEVTNAQYAACVTAGACSPAGEPLNGENFPVVNVTWNQANAYCTWIGRRLPNEAEWERAARGEDNWVYSWSNSIGMHFEWNAIYHGSPLSFCDASCPLPHFIDDVNDGYPTTAPVGSFASTDPIRLDTSKGFDVTDMNGNVREWVSNWYDTTAYQQGYPVDIFGPSNPTGSKVVRGGSWATEPLPLATRFALPPDQQRNDVGFRCAQ